MVLPAPVLLSAAAMLFARFAHADDDAKIPSTSKCLFHSLSGHFTLLPVNLYPTTSVTGPTTLDAMNFVTLGCPNDSHYPSDGVEYFSLRHGTLFDERGRPLDFALVRGLEGNRYGVTDSNVLRVSDRKFTSGTLASFCVDADGYLVGSRPLITDEGHYVSNRLKFYACPNLAQANFGGGAYKIYSNNVLDPSDCVPIYLSVETGPDPQYEEQEYLCQDPNGQVRVPVLLAKPTPYPSQTSCSTCVPTPTDSVPNTSVSVIPRPTASAPGYTCHPAQGTGYTCHPTSTHFPIASQTCYPASGLAPRSPSLPGYACQLVSMTCAPGSLPGHTCSPTASTAAATYRGPYTCDSLETSSGARPEYTCRPTDSATRTATHRRSAKTRARKSKPSKSVEPRRQVQPRSLVVDPPVAQPRSRQVALTSLNASTDSVTPISVSAGAPNAGASIRLAFIVAIAVALLLS